MFNIDFSTLPDISKKLSPEEISSLNTLFQDKQIQDSIQEIRNEQKTVTGNQKMKWIRAVSITLLCILLAWFMPIGIFYKILLTVLLVIGGGFFGVIYVYKSVFWYSSLNSEGIMKQKIFPRISSIVSPALIYNRYVLYPFDELEFLVNKEFLNPFDVIETRENSVHCVFENGCILRGFELETTGGGEVSNHMYLMRFTFSSPRFNTKHELHIKPRYDNSEEYPFMIAKPSKALDNFWKILGYILVLWLSWIASVYLLSFFDIESDTIVPFIVSLPVAYTVIHKYRKSSRNNKEIALENTDFSKSFVTDSSDQVESRTIITPSFMNKITALVRETNSQYEIFFSENNIYIKRDISAHGFLYSETSTDGDILFKSCIQFYIDMRDIFSLAEIVLYFQKNTNTNNT